MNFARDKTIALINFGGLFQGGQSETAGEEI